MFAYNPPREGEAHESCTTMHLFPSPELMPPAEWVCKCSPSLLWCSRRASITYECLYPYNKLSLWVLFRSDYHLFIPNILDMPNIFRRDAIGWVRWEPGECCLAKDEVAICFDWSCGAGTRAEPRGLQGLSGLRGEAEMQNKTSSEVRMGAAQWGRLLSVHSGSPCPQPGPDGGWRAASNRVATNLHLYRGYLVLKYANQPFNGVALQSISWTRKLITDF